ncbi:MAG: beta-lactamase family protein [Sphingomonadaceae bacterium]|nr:beta-lactamase family protein [Sphingomonadaceae bacterium]
MRRPLSISLTTCIAALAAHAASAQLPSVTAAAARVTAIAKTAHLSGEITIADRTGPLIDRAIGLADRGKQKAHRPGAQWLWASVTKQVTAVLVMQQVEAGTLSLDGTIRDYLPNFSGAIGNTITLRQLLQHLSGLPNPDDTPAGAGDVPTFYTETGPRIADTSRATGFCSGTPRAAPGAGFAYNNCDYLVLGAILERVTGKPYARLVADRVAKPLGLRSLKVARDGKLTGGGAATGYTTGGKPYPAVNVATFGAAGALTGTARDLVAFDRALAGGKLLGPESRALLWKGDPKLGYEALGVWSFPARLAGCAQPVTLIERRGDVGGIQVRNVIAPDLGRSVAVFVNDDTLDFGEVWQGKGLSYDLLSAAFCPVAQS